MVRVSVRGQGQRQGSGLAPRPGLGSGLGLAGRACCSAVGLMLVWKSTKKAGSKQIERIGASTAAPYRTK